LGVIAVDEGALKIEADEFAGRAIQHPLFGMVRWYLKSRGAVCFTTGMKLRKNMGKKYQLELDHIFPYSRLKKAGYGIGNRVKYALAQEFTNRAILTQIANRSKSDTDAADYLATVQARFPKALDLQCVPANPDLWQLDRYEDFLSARRGLLTEQLNAFLEDLTTAAAGTSPVTFEEQIAEGESDELEFKASLRWDLNVGVESKTIEQMVVKTVCAFANSQGGTLLIGVEDSGNILGLAHDYASLKDGKDAFELHLRNLLNQAFGAAFVAGYVTCTFPVVLGQEICRVDVTAGTAPLFVRSVDKNGVATERFYVRSGNSSQELPVQQLKSYWDQRFS
jgi:hypothetical protein